MQSFIDDRAKGATPKTPAAPIPDGPLLLAVPRAAALLGLSPRRLYDLAASGALPEGIVIRLGRTVRISRPRLLRWLEGEGLEGTDGKS